jgi:hypothetical protein
MIPVKQLSFLTGHSKEIYVDPNGHDTKGDGSINKPYLTLEKAASMATTGYLIIVNAGAYIVTTTAASGLAVSGVIYYFCPGASVSKATAGDMFNSTGFANSCSVLGFGTFSLSTASGYFFNHTISKKLYLEFNQITSTTNSCIRITAGQDIWIKGEYIKSTTLAGVSTITISAVTGINKVDISNIQCAKTIAGTAYCLELTNTVSGSIHFKSKYCYSNDSIGVTTSVYGLTLHNVYFDIDYATGYDLTTVLAVKINGDSITSSFIEVEKLTLNGNISTLNTSCYYAKINGNVSTSLTATTYVSESHLECNGLIKSFIMTDIGAADLRAYISTANSFTVDYGVVEIESLIGLKAPVRSYVRGDGKVKVRIFDLFGGITMSGIGKPELYIEANDAKCDGVHAAIDISADGEVEIKGKVINHTSIDISNNVILWDKGGLTLDGVMLIPEKADCYPIVCTKSAPQNLKITTKGTTVYGVIGSLLAGRKRKDKETISLVASTSLSINSIYTITEADTVTYNTKAKMAQRMAALVNGAVPGAIAVATQDTPAVDEYFYLESGTIGDDLAIVLIANLTQETLVQNSKDMNEILGGPIIETTSIS